MANLIGQGVVVQIFADVNQVVVRSPGISTEQYFTVTPPIDPNIMPGASIVFLYDDGSCVRQAGQLPDT